MKSLCQRIIPLGKRAFSSIDKKEIETFSQVNDWWSDSSSMIPLQAYNYARVNYMRSFFDLKAKPFENMEILDIGCGGGLLSESLNRLGAKVTAIDATFESQQQAKNHALLDPELDINYIHTTAEEHIESTQKQYDLVASVEVIEHVNDPQAFLESISKLVKKDGLVFVSTINKNVLSYLTLILGAEYVTRIVPIGTHHWEKFIEPERLQAMAQKVHLQQIDKQGFSYQPFSQIMAKSESLDVNYIMVFRKVE